MKFFLSFLSLTLFQLFATAQQIQIQVDAQNSLGKISPLVYGQFIEYIGRCIDGGIYEEQSSLTDQRGFRKDVLEKAKELNPSILRFPGGTVVKTFHWEDGIGPKAQRKAQRNLIWGGINTYHFGTCEFVEYCREIQADPCLVVNIATGSAEEAANWVEYCNGTGNTYYANLRRSHGYPEPFDIKYWALGNEEGAVPDAGRHQDPKKYVEDMWHFIKLMKLTDPSIKLIANGEAMNETWNKTVLDGLGDTIDYLSFHYYVNTDAGKPYSIFKKISLAEEELEKLGNFIQKNYQDSVREWSEWYRFPSRQGPIKIAFDEWGIWERQAPPYGTTNIYEWRHALATASFLNSIQRQAQWVGMANWAQLVNILAPIMSNEKTSIKQTIFYPLQAFRQYSLKEAIATSVNAPFIEDNIPALDVSATVDRDHKKLTLFIVNRYSKDLTTDIRFHHCTIKKLKNKITYSSSQLNAKNILDHPDKDVVKIHRETNLKQGEAIVFRGESITICEYELL
ncbi:alpha-L-arabinofuranosidase C-terminal domain-containing protein [Sphingobacterium sp. LRF_L2]|uniref:alpha-L-arabinofuranosidase C-terminal domain-containing protein n=1 Tax=Sphingobacterium sp. LRF_L2 TaxID=3369421 RepID=UPI003F6143E0